MIEAILALALMVTLALWYLEYQQQEKHVMQMQWFIDELKEECYGFAVKEQWYYPQADAR
jgi:hypothetical protein